MGRHWRWGRRRWEPRRVRLGVARGRAPSGAMASRIGKQRKQKKYSEGGVVFTPAFIARIPSAAAAKGTDDASDDATSDDFHAALAAFWARLRGFTALGSAEAELHGVHDLVARSRRSRPNATERRAPTTAPVFQSSRTTMTPRPRPRRASANSRSSPPRGRSSG